jgi:hypothetical protein
MSKRWVLDGGREGSGVLEINSQTPHKNLGILGMEVSGENTYRFAHKAEAVPFSTMLVCYVLQVKPA